MIFLQWVSHPKPRENKRKRVEEIVQERRKGIEGSSLGVANERSLSVLCCEERKQKSSYAGVKQTLNSFWRARVLHFKAME
jgi:hypothetical protein